MGILKRFAAVKYTADESSLDNPCIHLCNYSINKYHADFVVSEDPSVEDVGHKRSLTGFLKYLRSQVRQELPFPFFNWSPLLIKEFDLNSGRERM